MAAGPSGTNSQPFVVTPLSPEEEDQIILTRITLDERPLRRLIKKYHNYASASHTPVVPLAAPVNPTTIEDAREAFLLELASFELLMKKYTMINEAEARQVEEYKKEKARIDSEHYTLKSQIEELKVALEHAQLLRKRKMEYDAVAVNINQIPSRDVLEAAIQGLEDDMAAIRAEHDAQNRTIQNQKSALDDIIRELSSLRFMGKDPEVASIPQSRQDTPILLEDALALDTDAETAELSDNRNSTFKKDIELDPQLEGEKALSVSEGAIEENDIEMGEVEEDPKGKGKKSRDDLEEGEASDESSALSDPPDD